MMTNWILTSKEKPIHDQVCYVANKKAGLSCYIAIYYKDRDYFSLYNPECRDHPPIEVTHWIPLPEAPIYD